MEASYIEMMESVRHYINVHGVDKALREMHCMIFNALHDRFIVEGDRKKEVMKDETQERSILKRGVKGVNRGEEAASIND